MGSSFRDGSVMSFDGRNTLETNLSDLAELQGINLSDAPHKQETVVFVGIFIRGWGHFITDSMRLLWFLRTQEYAERFSECKLVYFPGFKFKLQGNYRKMFEILGIDCSRLIPVTELTRYDAVVIPDESFFTPNNGVRFFTQEYIETINLVRDYALANAKPVKSTKVYYSHRKVARNRSVGEDKLEKYFASKGYAVVYPEELSFDEQLNLLANCESFASTIGSCSYNMIFLRDNTEVILIPRHNYLSGASYQSAMEQVHALNITHIDSTFSIFAFTQGGPFLYFISSNLRKYFHDEDTESIVNASDFWKYLRLSFGLSFSRSFGMIARGDCPSEYKYYVSIAAEYFGKLFSQAKQSWPHRFRIWIQKKLHRGPFRR